MLLDVLLIKKRINFKVEFTAECPLCSMFVFSLEIDAQQSKYIEVQAAYITSFKILQLVTRKVYKIHQMVCGLWVDHLRLRLL